MKKRQGIKNKKHRLGKSKLGSDVQDKKPGNSYIDNIIANHKETIEVLEEKLKVARAEKQDDAVIRDIRRNIDVHRQLLANAEKRSRYSGWGGKTGEDFELGTPVVFGDESGEIVTRDGKRAISLYPDKNYSGQEERIVFPTLQEWDTKVKTFYEADMSMAKGGAIGKSGKKYGYTLAEYEKEGKKGLFVSPSEYWKNQEGSTYKDFIGRKQIIGDRDKDSVMNSYAYKIMIGIDLGSKLIPESARRYAEKIYPIKDFMEAGKFEVGGTIRKVKVHVPSEKYPIYATVQNDLGSSIITDKGEFLKKDIIKEFQLDSSIIKEHGGEINMEKGTKINKGPFYLKEAIIEWQEGFVDKGVKNKSYNNWDDLQKQVLNVYEEESGYNKTKIKFVWNNGAYKQIRIDVGPNDYKGGSLKDVVTSHTGWMNYGSTRKQEDVDAGLYKWDFKTKKNMETGGKANDQKSEYHIGQKVSYIPNLSGMDKSKPLIIEDKVYSFGDEFNAPGYYYTFENSNLRSHENDLKPFDMEHGGSAEVANGNYYVNMDDGTKSWYDVEKVEDVPNVYFAMGRTEQGMALSVPGEVYVHRNNALRPLFKKDGTAPSPIPEYAGKEGRELKNSMATGGKIKFPEGYKIVKNPKPTQKTDLWIITYPDGRRFYDKGSIELDFETKEQAEKFIDKWGKSSGGSMAKGGIISDDLLVDIHDISSNYYQNNDPYKIIEKAVKHTHTLTRKEAFLLGKFTGEIIDFAVERRNKEKRDSEDYNYYQKIILGLNDLRVEISTDPKFSSGGSMETGGEVVDRFKLLSEIADYYDSSGQSEAERILIHKSKFVLKSGTSLDLNNVLNEWDEYLDSNLSDQEKIFKNKIKSSVNSMAQGGFMSKLGSSFDKAKRYAKSAYEKSKPHLKGAYEKSKELAGEGYKKTKEALSDKQKSLVLDYLKSVQKDSSLNSSDKETIFETRKIISEISTEEVNPKDLVKGKKYNYLPEPGEKIKYKRFSNGKYFFKDRNGKPLALSPSELKKSISETKKYEQGGTVAYDEGGLIGEKIIFNQEIDGGFLMKDQNIETVGEIVDKVKHKGENAYVVKSDETGELFVLELKEFWEATSHDNGIIVTDEMAEKREEEEEEQEEENEVQNEEETPEEEIPENSEVEEPVMKQGGKISSSKKKLQDEIKILENAVENSLLDDETKEKARINIGKKKTKLADLEAEESAQAKKDAEAKIAKDQKERKEKLEKEAVAREKKLRTQSSKNKSIYIDIDKSLKEKMRNAIHAENIPYESKTEGDTFRVFLSNQHQLDIVTRLYNERRKKYNMEPVNKEEVTNIVKKRVGKLKFMPVKRKPDIKSKLKVEKKTVIKPVTKKRRNIKSGLDDIE